MPKIFGPLNSRYAHTGSRCPHDDLGFESPALTLRDALRAYEARFGVAISPCMAPLPGQTETKYFLVAESGGGSSWIVDIHIHRGGDTICPRQDMAFILQPHDLVEMGELVC